MYQKLTPGFALGAAVVAATVMSTTAPAFASASSVSGTVRLANGTAVQGATVSVRFGGSGSTQSDSNGDYSLTNLSGGFAVIDAVYTSGGTTYTGSAWIGFPPGGGATTADITVVALPPFGPFPPFGM